MKRLGGCVQGIAILVTALAAAYLALQPGHTAAFLSGLLAGIAGMAVVVEVTLALKAAAALGE